MAHAILGSDSKFNEATGPGAPDSCTNRASERARKVKVVIVESDRKDMIRKMVVTLMKKDANGDRESVIGFDAEYADSYGRVLPSNGQKVRISHLILTNGKKAYVVFLANVPTLPEPLVYFLLHPEFTFVSMGMKQRNDNLGRRYEAGCRNAVDLGQLASELKGNPCLRNCGIGLLAKGIGLSETPRPSVVCKNGFSRSYRLVDELKMTEAVANTCAYQQIGKILLFG